MKGGRTGDLWWKNAFVYCLDVQTFYDSNGDGIGDFRGLTERIDHLDELGVTCIWLMPFYPSPDRDDGYDITDYYAVDPRLGSLGDVVEFLRAARDRGMRVIADLVVNHTSDRHPWFRASRSSKDSPFRDWYVWRADPPDQGAKDVVFPDQETSVWELDEKTGEYYLHKFYKHQPDLNVANPAVRDEIARIMGFWLELGLSGFRVDAVPFLLETSGVAGGTEALPDPHDYLRDLRAFLSRRHGEAVLLGEVNLPYPDARGFFGDEDGDELTMLFDFPGMQALYLSLARADAGPLAAALQVRPPAPEDGQWATFVRNHDELTLDKLSEEERAEVFAAFGPDEGMQVYGRGLRRRLPPMLDGDQRRVRLAYSLLFALPGTPVLFYGEEIGMGENLDVPGRLSVRTPMQWEDDRTGGFSSAPPGRLVRPVPAGAYGPGWVNVRSQRHDPDSLLRFVGMLVRRRRECPELGWGELRLLDTGGPAVLAHRCDWMGSTVVVVHNLAPEPAQVRLDLPDCAEGARLVDLLAANDVPLGADGRLDLPVEAYGFRWLRVVRRGERVMV